MPLFALFAFFGLAGPSFAAPQAGYTASLSVEGRLYTLVLLFQPEDKPSAEVLTVTQHYVDVPEFHNGSMAGKDVCLSSVYLPLGTASLSVVDIAAGTVQAGWKENAPAKLIAESRDWSGNNKCGVVPGPLPSDAYAFIEGPLTVSIKDPKQPNWPLVSVEARFVENAVVRSQSNAALAASQDGKKLELTGFDGGAAAGDIAALVSRRKSVVGRDKFYWGEPELVYFHRRR